MLWFNGDEQAYEGLAATVTMAAPAWWRNGSGAVGWLSGRSAGPSGPPFLRYNVVDMKADLEVGFGVPGAARCGVLPPGRYAVVTPVGPPDTLQDATENLLRLGAGQGLAWDMLADGSREQWVAPLSST